MHVYNKSCSLTIADYCNDHCVHWGVSVVQVLGKIPPVVYSYMQKYIGHVHCNVYICTYIYSVHWIICHVCIHVCT